MFQTNAQAPLRGAATPDKPFGFYDATVDGGWTVPGEPYTERFERSRPPVQVVARAHARRPHESLGPHLAAQRPVRFQAALARRTRLRLADQLRGPRAVLRQGRDAHRRLRQQRRNGEHARLSRGRAAPAAEAARGRTARAGSARRNSASRSSPIHRAVLSVRQDADTIPAKLHPGNPEGAAHPRAGDARARRLLLGDGLRPRLLDPRELPVDDRASSAGAGDRQSRHPHQRDGARGDRRRRRQGDRRHLHRQDHRPGTRRCRRASWCSRRAPRSRCAFCSTRNRRAFPRASPTPAASSASTSWTPSARGSADRCRCWKTCRCTTRTAPAAITCTSPWWLYQEQHAGKLGFARGYHIEFGSGRAHARRGRDRRRRRARPAAATAGSSRRTRAATTARSSASPAAAK